mgnify:CR=1 FL=1
MKVLITGVTGYVGGTLLESLVDSGHEIRSFSRRLPAYLKHRYPAVDFVLGDASCKESVSAALQGIDVVYYFLHSMNSDADYQELDRTLAKNFAEAAADLGVRRIIYVGALTSGDEHLSKHFESRHEVGEILRSTGVQVIEFRASVVLGAGSLSFEMIRSLVEHLPFMVCPKWARTLSQPIFIGDLISYLKEALDLGLRKSRIFEVGGKEQVSYQEIMMEYARQRKLKRYILPVPLLTPHLSSLWLGLVTPLYARVGRKIIESSIFPSVVDDYSAAEFFTVKVKNLEESIRSSIESEDKGLSAVRWNDVMTYMTDLHKDWGGVHFGNRLLDSRKITVKSNKSKAFKPIRSIGGKNGWYAADFLWKVRGFLDLLVGGVGIRRGRRDPDDLDLGDAVDWWRVEDYKRDSKLLLKAEMRLPGRAWLEYEVEEISENETVIRQTAIFDPVGLFGLVYWYSLVPLHCFIFSQMLKRMAKKAENEEENFNKDKKKLRV